MSRATIESDPLFQLLTDALRAGPGSPQWRDAVAKVRSGGAEADEFKLIYDARERLESGREYRSVRAGTGFTRKLLRGIDEEEQAGRRAALPTANLIAVGSALAILIVLGLVAWLLVRGGAPGGGDVEELAGTYFPQTVAAVVTGPRELNKLEGWRRIGALPIHTTNGIRAGDPPAGAAAAAALGVALVTERSLAPAAPFAVEAELMIPATPSVGIAHVFVSDSADFSADRATSPGELVWHFQGGKQRVVTMGRSQTADLPFGGGGGAAPVKVRIVVGPEAAVVEVEERRVWAGPHGLSVDRPRYAGVRFLRGPGEKGSTAVVGSVRVLTRPNDSAGAD